MAINELLSVVPPPSNPVEAQDGEVWTRAQAALGINLPEDFRAVGVHYGTGRFCGGYLAVANPLSEHFETSMTSMLQATRDNRATHNYPYHVFPDKPGLLPWGADENGHVLHWLTEGNPDEWPVIVESHEGELERFDMSMTTFLARALKNDVIPKHIWNTRFTKDELTFTPLRRRVR
jgi:hypothetical protein